MTGTTSKKIAVQQRARRRRWRIALSVFTVIILGVLVTSYAATRPERVRSVMQSRLSELFGGRFRFSGPVDIAWGDGVTLHHVSLTPKGSASGEAVFQARRVDLRLGTSQILFGDPVPREIDVVDPSFHVVRDENGAWTFEGTYGDLAAHWSANGGAFPAIRVRGGSIHYRDSWRRGDVPVRQDLLDIDASIDLASDGIFRFEGTTRTAFLDRLEIRGELAPARDSVAIAFRAKRFNVSSQLMRMVGPQAEEMRRRFNLHGFVDLKGEFQFDKKAGLIPTGVSGVLLNCYLQPPAFPLALKGVSGEFELDGTTLRLKSIEGSLGAGAFRCDGVVEATAGWTKIAAVKLAAEATAVPIDSHLHGWVRKELVARFDQLNSRGIVGMKLDVNADGFPLDSGDIILRVTIDDVQWRHQGFPYSLTATAGELELRGDRLTIVEPIEAFHDETKVVISGHAVLSDGGEVDVRCVTKSLPLDNDLRISMPVGAIVDWDLLRPSGTVGLEVVVSRTTGSDEIDVKATATCRDVSIEYTWFPYRISDITGEVRLDWARQSVSFSNLQGYHESELITLNGSYEIGGEEGMKLVFHTPALDLEDQLTAALPNRFRQLLKEFQIEGSAAVDVTVATGLAPEPRVGVELTDVSCSTRFVHFPYPLKLRGGRVSRTGDESFRFDGFETDPDFRPRVRVSGKLETVGAERVLEYRLGVTDLDVDDRLRDALPNSLRQVVEEIGLRGTFSGELFGSYSYKINRPDVTLAVYQASNVTITGGSLDFGLALTELEGTGDFVGGRKTLDGGHTLDGMAFMKRARFNDLRFRDVDMAFAYGQEHYGIDRARRGRPLDDDGATFVPPPEMILRLSGPEKVRNALQVQLRGADFYGGGLEGFLYIDVGEQRDFSGQYSAQGVQIKRAAKDVFGVSDENKLEGSVRGNISFRGSTGKNVSIVGKGEAHTENARLLDLPLFVKVLGVLVLSPKAIRTPTERARFTKLSVKFDIREEKFWAPAPDGLSIIGNAIHLLGAGSLDFVGKLDVLLTPSIVDWEVPVFEKFIERIKQPLAQIGVRGSLKSPEVSFDTFAGFVKVPIGREPAAAVERDSDGDDEEEKPERVEQREK